MQIFADKIFKNPIKVIQAFDNESFFEAFSEIENLRKCHNNYLLGYIRYEAKEIFLRKKIKSKLPLLYFEVFKELKKDFKTENLSTCKTFDLLSEIDYEVYSKAIDKIKEEIACGNTYQVNYTYDYKVETQLKGFDLYQAVLPNQKTPYNAYIKNEYEEILSFSPELFFELKGNKIRTKPMKGTVKRGNTPLKDRENIAFLKNDIKNRAENVMIVDLLRNDLGKIAKTGSVKVDKLFEIESHNTLHQMTSEISAELEDNITLFEIFKAIFPCGSVTGAPKINTMEIIEKIEKGKRGVYCGAIGLITPEKTVFSVPIRILQKKTDANFYSCRVGGAIVWDSTSKEEWDETLTKIKFLFSMNNLKLVETILIKNGEMKYKKEHINRMKKSAKELGFKFNLKDFDFKIPKSATPQILRILLSNDGGFETELLPLETIKTNKINLSTQIINSKELFLKHKTTYRPWYENATQKIKSGLVFDEIFLNEKGELTEGARGNIVLQIKNKLFTPQLKSGILNGILRQKLLKSGKIKEKNLYVSDLKKAQKIFCINSVRGIVEVEIER
jgi:para-aminobenzoate synthetase/4-amino-4-deoxychorismate lyase